MEIVIDVHFYMLFLGETPPPPYILVGNYVIVTILPSSVSNSQPLCYLVLNLPLQGSVKSNTESHPRDSFFFP